MTPRERRTLLVASLILLLASGARYGYETRVRAPLFPDDSAGGVGAALLEATREVRAEEERRSLPLAAGEQLDPNRAPPQELDRLPGVGPAVADRIVEERSTGGAFRSAADLDRVRGIGPATVGRLEPYLDFTTPPPATLRRPPDGGRLSESSRRSVSGRSGESRTRAGPHRPTLGSLGAATGDPGHTPSRPVTVDSRAGGSTIVDLNRAGVDELQSLRGVGPVLAERIVGLRREKGRFGSIEELLEVRGVGPATLDNLRPRIRVGP